MTHPAIWKSLNDASALINPSGRAINGKFSMFLLRHAWRLFVIVPVIMPVIALVIPALIVTSPDAAGADTSEAIVPETLQLDRPISFAQDILPILQANCIACHNRTRSEGELVLESVASILAGGSSGSVVVAGKPDQSYFYRVAARIEESFMPPLPNKVQARRLTPREVGLLRQWILEGAVTGPAAVTSAATWQPISAEMKAIYSTDVDPFGRFVAAGRAGDLTVYDLTSVGRKHRLIDPTLEQAGLRPDAHRDYVHAVAFHPDGSQLASAGYQVVKIWEREPVLSTLSGIAQSFVVPRSSDQTNELIAIRQTDGAIQVMDRATGDVLHTVDRDLSADRSLTDLAARGANLQLLTVGHTGTIELIDVTSQNVTAESDDSTAFVSATFCPGADRMIAADANGALHSLVHRDGRLVSEKTAAASSNAVQQIQVCGEVLLCRTAGSVVEVRHRDSLDVTATITCAAPVTSASISSDGQRVVTITSAQQADLWNAQNGSHIASLSTDLAAARHLQRQQKLQQAFDARVKVVSSLVTAAEKRLTEHKTSLTKTQEAVAKAEKETVDKKAKAAAEAMKVATAKQALAAKPEDGNLKTALEAAEKSQQAAAKAQQAAESAEQTARGSVAISRQAVTRAEAALQTQQQEQQIAQVDAAKASEAVASAKTKLQPVLNQFAAFVLKDFVVTANDEGILRIWKVSDGTPTDVLQSPQARGMGRVTAMGVAGDAVLMQFAENQLTSMSLFPAWQCVRQIGTADADDASGFVDRVTALAYSPDGHLLAAGGGEASRSGEITLWNVADGSLVRTIEDAHSDTVYGLEFSRNGRLLASGAADKFARIFDVATGNRIRSFEGHTHHVMDVSWKGDGTALVTASADHQVKVWNTETGVQTRSIKAHSKEVGALRYIGFGDDFISCGGDRQVLRQNAANGNRVRAFGGSTDFVHCVTSTDDGNIVVAGGEDGILRVWDGRDGKVMAALTPE